MYRKYSAQELFGSYNIEQYLLTFSVGDLLINMESEIKRVATEEEIKWICQTVLSEAKIEPTTEIVHMLHLAAIAFYSSNEGKEFCNDFKNRSKRAVDFDDEDAKAVKKICEDFMAKFLKGI